MTTGRGQAPNPAPRGNRLSPRSSGTGHEFIDLGDVQRTELILDALAGRRGPRRESTDPAAGLLAALAADVDEDVLACSWSWPWLVKARRALGLGSSADTPGATPGGRQRK